MSVDEFDPTIERLFNRAPELSDSRGFETRVMGRLQSSTRGRAVILGGAGLIGGCVAFGEIMNLSFSLQGGRMEGSMSSDSGPIGALAHNGGQAAESLMNNLGLASFDMGSMGQTETFLGVAAMLLTLLTLGAVKLFQQV